MAQRTPTYKVVSFGVSSQNASTRLTLVFVVLLPEITVALQIIIGDSGVGKSSLLIR